MSGNLNNQKGVSIIEALMGLGILGAMALGFSQMFSDGYKRSADLTQKQEARDLKDELNVAVKRNACGLLAPATATNPTPLVTDLNLVVDVTSSGPVILPALYGFLGQKFESGNKYGRLTIANNNPFIIRGLSRNSPLTQGLSAAAKTAGNYYLLGDEYLGEIQVKLNKSKGSGSGTETITFIAYLKIDPVTNILTDCKSVSEISSLKDTCNGMAEGDNINFVWDENTMSCSVTVTVPTSSDGVYTMSELGSIKRDLYFLNEIP
jgi:hypothetical protein